MTVTIQISLTSNQNIDDVLDECRLSGVRVTNIANSVITGRVDPFQISALRAIEDVREVRVVAH